MSLSVLLLLWLLVQDPVGIVSESWPDWCDTVAMDFSELLPFDVRLKYFQSTAFSRARVSSQPFADPFVPLCPLSG